MPVSPSLAELSLEAKVGQLCSSTIYHRPSAVARMVAAGQLGALTVSWPDMDSPAETARLLNRLQESAPLPLLISADFEAGGGRLLPGATHLPTLMALGAAGDPDLAREHGRVTAAEARAVGVHQIFGPVVDVNINPDNPIINVRAFGGEPELVSQLAQAWIAGCREGGALACAKHFPGHGDTAQDTHLELAQVPHASERLERVELAPFQAAIEAGVDAIMSAHIAFPAIDPSGLPATLSRPILTGLLRERMGFDGLIVTDAMEMYAIARRFGQGEAAVMAVEAGADLVLSHDPAVCYQALLAAAREGRLSAERIDRSVERLLAAKQRLGLFELRAVDPARAATVCGVAEHREVGRRIAEAAVTELRGRLAGAADDRWLLLVPDYRRYTGESVLKEVARHLREGALPHAVLYGISDDPTAAEIEALVADRGGATRAALLVVALARAYHPESSRPSAGQVRLAQALGAHLPVAVIGLGSPYGLPAFHDAAALGCTYGADPASVRAALDVLAGRLAPQGRLPVEVRGL